MAPPEARITCHTPTPGKRPTTIAKWKYELVRAAVLQCITSDPSGVEFRQLPALVERRLSAEERRRLGSPSWYVTVVKLDMEVKGELERIPGITPQRLRRPIE